MIKKYALISFQKVINLALSLDEALPKKLLEVEGKTIQINILPLNISFFMIFRQGTIELVESINDEADTIIESSPIGFIRLSYLPASQARSLFNDNIKISGDIELGTRIKQLFDTMDIDWEGQLAQFTGDAIAHQVGTFARKSFSFVENIKESMKSNLSNYLQEEIKLFPPREEIEDFFNDIDALSLQVERLDAQIIQLLAFYETD